MTVYYSGNCIELKTLEANGSDAGLIELVVNLKKESINKLNSETLKEVGEAIAKIPPTSKGLMISSGKDAFLAGADITEFLDHFKKPEAELKNWIAMGQSLFSKLEDFPGPSVAVVSGFALGGGMEFALTCDFRIASIGSKLGLPETKLGIMPGWGATVRLPRLIGLDPALEWITSGNQYDADAALKFGAIDAVVAATDLRAAGTNLLLSCLKGDLDWQSRRKEKQVPMPLNSTEKTMAFTINKGAVFAMAGKNYPAPVLVIDTIEKSFSLNRDEAMDCEAASFAKISKTPSAQAMVGNFLADQAVKKKAKGLKSLTAPVTQSAVLGAGIMGGGIAYQSAVSKVPIFLKDIRPEALTGGMKEATVLLDKQIQRGKATALSMADTLSKITPTLKQDDLKAANFVIEAVTENEAVKIKVLQEMEATLNDTAFLTSNTSTISITGLAEKLKRPEQFCGMHFFNPVPKMPLVEIIRGKKSSPATIATAVQYALTMGKTPIVVNDCPGFLVNRVLFAYFTAFNQLVAAGVDFARIDQVMEKWGWPMGPAFLLDVVGIDTAHHASDVMAKGFPDRMSLKPEYSVVKLYEAKRFGQKNGKGFYQYSVDAKGKPKKEINPEIYSVLGQDPKAFNTTITDAEIIDRLMLAFIAESAHCLEENIVEEAYELDLAMLTGLGFPPFRGGPCRYADSIGGAVLLEKMQALNKTLGSLYLPTSKMMKKESFYV
jgi:3-hydroxyacyl-CoA dehydrogenase/enoyl-CoA hydratase/3-hydroxybutyryl-CoA epimerase/enoyl-CoA isomerase